MCGCVWCALALRTVVRRVVLFSLELLGVCCQRYRGVRGRVVLLDATRPRAEILGVCIQRARRLTVLSGKTCRTYNSPYL